MHVLFINNDGGGFAGQVKIKPGTTVGDLFKERIPSGVPEDYLIRVNRQPCNDNQVLQDGDRVSMTPIKIEGASR